jgi:hypothetical protein
MADTFTAGITGIVAAASKTGLAMWNTDPTKIMRVYQIWVMNNQHAVVTGIPNKLEVHRITTCTGGRSTQNIITKHNTANSLSASAVAYYDGPTVTKTDLMRLIFSSGDERQANNTPTIEDLCGLNPFNLAYEVGFNETTVEPIVCRQNQGVSISWSSVASPVGTLDFFIKFTLT